MTSDRTRRAVRRAAEFVARADALLITAGAGMSVDSGLPDFRGHKAFWGVYPPLEKLRISFDQMAQPHWFAEKPEMAWAWYGHRQQLYREASPHAGYQILREWVQAMPAGCFVVTSNVDGRFFSAGFPAQRVVEQHGSIHRYQCTTPCTDVTWDAEPSDLKIDLVVLRALGDLPRCPACAALARPNVLMFNDTAWVQGVTQQQIRRFEQWLARVRGRRVVILECGAGTAIPTIRRVRERVAERARTTLVRINPAATEEEESALVLKLTALQALTMIQEALPESFRRKCADAALEERDWSAEELGRSITTPAGSDCSYALETLPARDMQTIEFCGVPKRHRAPAWSAETPGPFDLTAVMYVDLDIGQIGPFNYLGIRVEDERACWERWAGPAVDKHVPLPDVGGLSTSGYLTTGRLVQSPESVAGGRPGAAVLYICGPDREPIMTVGIARRPLEGAYLWRMLYETATTAPKPLEYPRAPWVARRLDAAATRHAAMLPVLAAIERVMAWTWLRLQAYYDQQRREDGDE